MKLAVVLYTTHDWPGVKFLTDSLERWGWPTPIVIVGDGVFRGHMGKLLSVKWRLPELRREGYTHALYTDCWDVLCCGPFSELIDSRDSWERGALLSADAGNWGTVGLENERFPDTGTPFRFVNGGGWVGEIEYLVDRLLCRCEEEPHIDQWWLARRYLLGEPGISIDHRCGVFQCLSQTQREWFSVDGDRVVNERTGTMPLLVHGAGGADMSWVPSVTPWRAIPRH